VGVETALVVVVWEEMAQSFTNVTEGLDREKCKRRNSHAGVKEYSGLKKQQPATVRQWK